MKGGGSPLEYFGSHIRKKKIESMLQMQLTRIYGEWEISSITVHGESRI